MSDVSPPTYVPGTVQKNLTPWLSETEAGLVFGQMEIKQVFAVIEMAARVPDDEFAKASLTDIVKLMLALESIDAPAGKQLRTCIEHSEAAQLRLAKLGEQRKKRSVGFLGSGSAKWKGVPTVGAPVPERS